ncbi:hypothetical protein FQN54_001988 [Arachnomyces sp. PD_36]|nr:hypothetical protein FQN54_001988 [Arachnomyces sp. PD_36]
MSNFPKLQPAFTILVEIDAPVSIGSVSKNNSLSVVPMTGGTIKSEPGFSPALDSKFVGTGNDYIRNDVDRKRMRLDAHGVVKTDDGAGIYLHYTGVAEATEEITAALTGSVENITTSFGNTFTHITFETGSEAYKGLEDGVFVATGRFIREKGKPIVVEYKVSQVVQG